MLLCFLLFLQACDPPLTVGISRLNTTSKVQILFFPCPGDVLSVAVQRQKGDAPGDADDEVLWRIVSLKPSGTRRFVVGELPRDFAEAVPLSPLPTHQRLFAFVHTSGRGEFYTGFQLDELAADRISSHGHTLPAKHFHESC